MLTALVLLTGVLLTILLLTAVVLTIVLLTGVVLTDCSVADCPSAADWSACWSMHDLLLELNEARGLLDRSVNISFSSPDTFTRW